MSAYDELRRQGVAAFVRETGRDAYWRALAGQRARYLGADGRARAELVEAVVCAACDRSRARLSFEKDGFTYLRCVDCGTVYISPSSAGPCSTSTGRSRKSPRAGSTSC